MRVSWFLVAALVMVGVAQVLASPHEYEATEPNTSSGSKTWHAVKQFFRPVSDYFRGLPAKTPSDVATDVKEKVTDVKEWAKENEAIQGLISALGPVNNWVKEKANTLQDKSFRDMYDDVKEKVLNLDDKIGTWIQNRNDNNNNNIKQL